LSINPVVYLVQELDASARYPSDGFEMPGNLLLIQTSSPLFPLLISVNHTRSLLTLQLDGDLASVFAELDEAGARHLRGVLSAFEIGGPSEGSREIIFRIHVAVSKEQF
jgi:hypothetical protein